MKYASIWTVISYLLTALMSAKAGEGFYRQSDTLGKIEISKRRAAQLLLKAGKQDPWEKMPDASSIAWLETGRRQSGGLPGHTPDLP